jgi:lipopolysaccharide transport system ATP-binding protein
MAQDQAAIRVEHLSKRYSIGHEFNGRGPRASLRETLTRHARNLQRKAADLVHGRQIIQGDEIEEFWALKDVSFEVSRGEVVGIIGLNGAGKTTLLKILSRITEPTEGRATIRGRVASLLEVGTGFHFELTGRENIYLNGAILGMTRSEITRKFDEIVDFAEVEKFLDTPVKRYSSGMYVRLAFAVAAHLEPEILIVDEVLAVGDVVFQKKCLGKMHDVAQGGRTVLFVSHNLPAILGLTNRAMLIDHGRLVIAAPTGEVISRFLQDTQRQMTGSGDLSPYRRRYRADGYVDIRSIKVCGNEPGLASVGNGDSLVVDVGLSVHRRLERALLVVNILNEQVEVLATIISADNGAYFSLDPGVHTIRCDVGALPLVPGDYRLSVGIAQSSNVLAWDVLEALPGFRLDSQQNPAWLQSPDRAGVLLLDRCTWKHC